MTKQSTSRSEKGTNIAFLSLGSNLGDRKANLEQAIVLLGERVGTVCRVSSFLETEPWGFSSDNYFINACVKLETPLSPREVLLCTQQIEREMGRNNKSKDGKYHDRPIDIDILLYGDVNIDEPGLTIPHPLMEERDFVMIPLMEIRK